MDHCRCAEKESVSKYGHTFLGSTIIFILMPKCVFCVQLYATFFSSLGLSFAYSSVLFWFALAVTGVTSLYTVIQLLSQKLWAQAALLTSGTLFLGFGKYLNSMPILVMGIAIVFIGLGLRLSKRQNFWQKMNYCKYPFQKLKFLGK